MKIIRVFPQKTSFTPKDDYAFIGDPQLFRPEANEVHISCVFTWDKKEALRLQKAWQQYYPVVKVGGCAFDDPSLDFVPGRYIKTGVTFTSRGCNNNCEFCLVPKREGKLRIINDFASGNIIQDNNLLQTGKNHISKVIEMLKKQKAAVFSGGIESDLVSDWVVKELRNIKIKELFLACDTWEAIKPLQKAASKLKELKDKLYCYSLIGKNETISRAELRLKAIWETGCIPFAQLYQPPEELIEYPKEWRDLARKWSRPAIIKSSHKKV